MVAELLHPSFGSVVQTVSHTAQQPINQIACREARCLVCWLKKSLYKVIRSALLAAPFAPQYSH